MDLSQVKPVIPEWAAKAGCPPPEDGECFICYVTRLGLDWQDLVRDMNPQIPDYANIRLRAALEKGAPAAFADHLTAY